MLFRELEKQRQRRRGDVRPKVEIAIFRRADVRGCERAQALKLEHGVDVGEKRTPALPADGDTRQPRRHGRFDPDAGAFDAVHPIDQRVDTRPPVGGQGVRAEPAALRARRDDGVELVLAIERHPIEHAPIFTSQAKQRIGQVRIAKKRR